MNYKILQNALKFYNITDETYINKCLKCLDYLNSNSEKLITFNKLCKLLFSNNIEKIKELWNIKDTKELFGYSINPFVTSLILLSGFQKHNSNMKKYIFDKKQIKVHKLRVKEVLENDIFIKNYDGIRVSQMLWGTYFINCRLIEVGVLQYEYYNDKTIKIHIPKNINFSIESIKQSLNESRKFILKHFNIYNYEYFCNTWLLSKQIHNLVDKETNIYQFYNLFEIKEGENCIFGILNFVYGLQETNNFNNLDEKTSLQRKIKRFLIEDNEIRLGIGKLKYYK